MSHQLNLAKNFTGDSALGITCSTSLPKVVIKKEFHHQEDYLLCEQLQTLISIKFIWVLKIFLLINYNREYVKLVQLQVFTIVSFLEHVSSLRKNKFQQKKFFSYDGILFCTQYAIVGTYCYGLTPTLKYRMSLLCLIAMNIAC